MNTIEIITPIMPIGAFMAPWLGGVAMLIVIALWWMGRGR